MNSEFRELKSLIMGSKIPALCSGHSSFFFFFKLNFHTFHVHKHFTSLYLFIYLFMTVFWVFVVVHRLSLFVATGGYSLLRCAGFSLRWLLLLRSMGSGHARFSSCSTHAQ